MEIPQQLDEPQHPISFNAYCQSRPNLCQSEAIDAYTQHVAQYRKSLIGVEVSQVASFSIGDQLVLMNGKEVSAV